MAIRMQGNDQASPAVMGVTQSSVDPASWFRFVQFVPHLEKAGWRVEHRPNRPDRQWRSAARTRLGRALQYHAGRLLMRANRMRDLWDSRAFDVVFINRDIVSEGTLFQQLFRPMLDKAVFDFNEAVFMGRREERVRWMCANARWVTPGNSYLADYASHFTDRVTVLPTVVDTDDYRPRCYSGRAQSTGPVRVGWSGSDHSIATTLIPHLAMLRALQERVDFELVVITNTRPLLPVEGLRWTFHPWSRGEERALESKFDIGIMPMIDAPGQKGKCALKLLQYMAAGLPTVASPVGVGPTIVSEGKTGFLAGSVNEWHQALSRLIMDAPMRAAMGTAGRRLCEGEYSVQRWLPVLLGIFETVRNETTSSA